MKDPFNFAKLQQDFKRSKRKIIRDITQESSTFFKDDVFNAQGFIDRSVKRWPKRKGNKDPDRKLNVKTGRMRIAISPRFGRNKGTVKSDVPYSGHVNDIRPFMGRSVVLDKRAKKIIFKALNKMFKKPPRIIVVRK